MASIGIMNITPWMSISWAIPFIVYLLPCFPWMGGCNSKLIVPMKSSLQGSGTLCTSQEFFGRSLPHIAINKNVYEMPPLFEIWVKQCIVISKSDGIASRKQFYWDNVWRMWILHCCISVCSGAECHSGFSSVSRTLVSPKRAQGKQRAVKLAARFVTFASIGGFQWKWCAITWFCSCFHGKARKRNGRGAKLEA